MTRVFVKRCLIILMAAGIALFYQGMVIVQNEASSYNGDPKDLKDKTLVISECACKNDSGFKVHAEQGKPKIIETRILHFKEIQKNRTKTVLNECDKLKETSKSKYIGTLGEDRLRTHMIYDEQKKFVFCDLPKVGSTYLKQVLHILTGHRKVKNPHEITGGAAHAIPFNTFNKLSYDKVLNILLDSTKFLFVRNPYARILSGYVDKIYTNNIVFWGTAGRIIIKDHRRNPDKISLECGHNTTFPEFIRHIINAEKTLRNRNPHWYPMYDACRPCTLKYDIIGKIEHFKEDLDMILRVNNWSSTVNISLMNEKNDDEAISLTIDRAFEAVAKKPKCVTITDAFRRAWNVLQIRGVISHTSNFPEERINTNPKISKMEILKIVREAVNKHKLSRTDKALVREQAIVKAYGSLSKEELTKFHEIFHPDFVLFGYDKLLPKQIKQFINWNPLRYK